MESAALEEDSGDRWRNSDLSKALRFYQSAFEAYLKAIDLSEKQQDFSIDRVECYYNALRLLLLVYNQFQGTECIDISLLASAPEVLQAGSRCVLQDISNIIASHEKAINVVGNDVSPDLLFNTALAYAEVVESQDDEARITEAVVRAITLLQQLFSKQVQEFLESLGSSNDLNKISLGPENVSNENTQFIQSSTAQPPDIVDTAIAFFSLFRSWLDNVSIEPTESVLFDFKSSLSEVAIVVDELFQKYYPSSKWTAPITREQKDEYSIVLEYARSTLLDFGDAFVNWESENLPETAERYMLAADSIQTILDRRRLNSSSGEKLQEHEVQLYWTALCKMNAFLKKAQELLQARNAQLKSVSNPDQNSGLGGLILQICTVYIARADIDQQRSRLQYSEAQIHQQVLGRNSIAFLKNAIALSKQSGGLRETTVEKLQRKKVQMEAQTRLFILEGKSEEEMAGNFKNTLWLEEYEECQTLWYYHHT